MAVILEKVLRGQIQPSYVIDWLLLKLPPDPSDQNHAVAFQSCDSLRGTFVNFFINYLRTQASQLSVNGQATFASPVRKPVNVTPSPKHPPTSGSKAANISHRSKVQLFGSPASSDLSDISALDTSFSSFDVSSHVSNRSRKGIRKELTTSPFSSTDEDGWSSPATDLLAKRSVGRKVNVKSKSNKSHSFFGKTSKDWNKTRRNVSAPEPSCNYSIDSLQDFPSIGSTGLSTSTPRRITPTAVSTPLNISAKDVSFGEKPFSSWPAKLPGVKDSSPSPSGKPDLGEERDLLKKMKSSKSRSAVFHTAINRSPQLEKRGNDSVCEMIPELDKVTNQECLEIIIELYNGLLEVHLVPNLWMEIYFLFQLLTVKGNTSDNASFTENSSLYLSTVHNAVYFAAEVLNKQRRYLAHFDKATLKQLFDNEAIQKFKPSLHNQLRIYCENSSSNLVQPSKFTELLGAVPFHVETDNRENFPSDKAFHCFKKQRDKFYELLREWQVNHTSPGWNMRSSMSLRIRELIGMTSDITNIFHFAKLFTSQLINMCTGDKDVESNDSSDNIFLNHFKMANPDKLKRLEERFINPSSVIGPCPLPQFRGQQEFFQKFIEEGDSFLFNQYLMDCFSSRIIELNKFNSYIPDLNTSDSHNLPDKDQRDQFTACVQTLQLLAKFLGLVTFLPYKQMGKLSEKLKEEITASRQKVPHQLDVLSCLQSGYSNHRLILVVPWLVEYLSMLDASAVSMEYYRTTLNLLRTIYRTVGLSSTSEFPACNQFLLLVLISWLFEVLLFTPDINFSSVKEQDDNDGDVSSEPRLDHIPFVEQPFLYSCCPYLSDIKTLLSESTASSPMRKITPVAASATQPEINTGFLSSKVQSDLERNFLHNQSPSLKKTVEFVGSRVASNCIKLIDSQELTVQRRLLSELIMKKFQTAFKDSNDDLDEFRKDIQEIAAQRCKETIKKAEDIAKSFIEEKCKIVMKNIVSEEISVQVMRTACSLAIRNSLQKTERWIHVQIPGAYRQEIESCLQKCSKIQSQKENPAKDESSTSTRHSDMKTLSTPSALLQELKDAIYQLLTTSDPDELVDQHFSLIVKAKEVLKEKHMLPHLSVSALESLLKELIALTCIVSPSSIPLPVDPPREEHGLPTMNKESMTQEFHASSSLKHPASNCAIKSGTSENRNNLQKQNGISNMSQSEQFGESLQQFSVEPLVTSDVCLSGHNISQTRNDFLQEIISLSKSQFPDKLDRESFFSSRTDLLLATSSGTAEARKELQNICDYFVEINIIQDYDLS